MSIAVNLFAFAFNAALVVWAWPDTGPVAASAFFCGVSAAMTVVAITARAA